MQTNLDQLLDKLTKIQELIDRGATAGEVAAAANRMQYLLSKHNLSIELVKMHKGAQRDIPQEFKATDTNAGWTTTLITGIAHANYGKVVRKWQPGTSGRGHKGVYHCYVVCHKEDYETIRRLYDQFSTIIERMAPIQYEAARQGYDSSALLMGKRQWCNDWRDGCAAGIANALQQARREAERATEGSSALVLVKEAAVAERYNELYPSLRTVSRDVRNSSARRAGYNTGTSLGRGTSIAS